FVTCAMHGLKVDWIRRISLQFLPQLYQLIIDRARRRIVVIAPHFVQQLFPAYDTLRIRNKKFQHPELLRSKRDVAAAACELHLAEINYDIAKACGCAFSSASRAAHRRLNPRQQLSWTEGFRNVVIRAELEEQYLVSHIGNRAENHHRKGR